MVTAPAATPVTNPVAETVAIVVLLVDQLPPVADSLSLTVSVAHMELAPLIVPAETDIFTVSWWVVDTVPQ